MSKDMADHRGHRARLKDRFLSEGLEHFADHNTLELLLFYAIPQKDTNALAHALIAKFGSLSGVFDASYEELLKVSGVGENVATLIKLIPQMSRRYQISRQSPDMTLNTVEKAGTFLLPRFIGARVEIVLLLCLDGRKRLLSCEQVGEGTVSIAQTQTRRVVELALAHNAASVILAHNHLSGNALPSQEDQITTLKLRAALEGVGVALDDHIIVADDDFVSLAQSGLLVRKY